ncbi:hypothetical protein DICSQDRAFT_96444 [Dichomitus squalens LYAD-421 SS1]|uniref:uncharacterized protein n=1 Tax=Dichomitus squalens (strain LYAD-421) TaxID=732165 RepID=UPI00044127AE|nr:uncharacterized protein DICSQDRAFT_96444 [Dichomitus squalens LYAD-421 SS1]EJF67220.1 hypothetical protein DICSQDRAFT_96444 [Dichomitus squalens LYAD-421 SS1]
MLAHLTQASRRPATQAATTARACLAAAPRRRYAQKSEGGPEDPFKSGPTYAQWLRTEGIKYKDAHRPKNWLGGQVPFPLNPSFKPPTPISDSIRTAIWNDFIADPEVFNPRILAQRHGLSIARVDAILRLKGLEQHWQKVRNKPLQTGFLKGMEYALGVTEKQTSMRTGRRTGGQELGENAVEADELSEATKDFARARYQRMFWEPVVEGKNPILPTSLARAAVDGVNSKQSEETALLKRLRHLKSETEPDVVLERPGRPTIRFVDVGVKFVDVKDRLKRVKAAKRRSVLKRRRRGGHVSPPEPQADAASVPA